MRLFIAFLQAKYNTEALGVFSSRERAEAACQRAEARVDRGLAANMVDSWVLECCLDQENILSLDAVFRPERSPGA